ncbi:MotA/TolQ/ExbB proton channel family protein [Stieleria varia]|uniref:Colicin uptake protein TolQ n=1 Tax=Stieleria varia TaxID=2528005 RepID=A0A5C6AG33_9BACT|nr:MotA/TolQ/ExbB proton channel family protein [Stieleria varia]TWT98366.1 colicin uptake protein TolQ [Stieleria varia]
MLLLTTLGSLSTGNRALGQGPDESEPDNAAAIDAAAIQAVMNAEEEAATDAPAQPSGIDLLSLISSGGRFMIPIGLMSLLVVTLATERALSLRRSKVLPKQLIRELHQLSDPVEKLRPKLAYLACQENPSPTARVIGSMLLRTGQPLGEIERTANEAVQRQADEYAAPIRWLNLAAAATPLMGLLGTVWGMIVAFHESTSLTADRSRSEQLSEGIYTALVTTLAGLAVAIPAAILAQYLENRVSKLFHEIEQLAFDMAPGLAKFQGRQRLDVDGNLHPIEHHLGEATPPPPPLPPRPAATAGGTNVN